MDPYKMVIAVTNQKGGCAKTTTSVNLATVLAEGNRKYGIPASKVLLIDLDPQGNVSTSFGIDKSKLKKTVSDVLMNDLGDELPLMDDYIIPPEGLTEAMRTAWSISNSSEKIPEKLKVENLYLLPSNDLDHSLFLL